jgi:hypothetical protein
MLGVGSNPSLPGANLVAVSFRVLYKVRTKLVLFCISTCYEITFRSKIHAFKFGIVKYFTYILYHMIVLTWDVHLGICERNSNCMN